MSFFAAVLLFLSACNGSESTSADKTSSDSTTTTTTDTTATVTAPAPPSTISTSPQGMFITRHKVSNFAKWLAAFEAHDSLKLANGLHNYVVGRSAQDSNMVLVATKADDMAKAKAFAKSPALKQAMQKSGITGQPTMMLVNAVYQDTAVLGTDLRSLTTFTVKDWGAWQKAFAEGRQERLDNGIVERVFGHDPDNDKKVMLVTAITDTAKASAYWKSDMLKKRREASGVTSTPDRFVFHVVKRY